MASAQRHGRHNFANGRILQGWKLNVRPHHGPGEAAMIQACMRGKRAPHADAIIVRAPVSL